MQLKIIVRCAGCSNRLGSTTYDTGWQLPKDYENLSERICTLAEEHRGECSYYGKEVVSVVPQRKEGEHDGRD